MTFPCIKIQFKGTTCTCCNSTQESEFKVAYRADTDSFVAMDPSSIIRNSRAVTTTLQAIQDILSENYQISLEDIPFVLNEHELPSVQSVRNVEAVAQQMFRESRNDLAATGRAPTNTPEPQH